MFLTASIKTLYAAFFSYSDNLGNFLETFNWWTLMYKQCCWNTLNFWNYAPWKPLNLCSVNFLSNYYKLQSGLDKSGFEVRSLKCQEDNCVHVCSELLDYLAKIGIIILLLLLLAWVAKIRSESKRPYLILGQLVFIAVYIITVTFSFAFKNNIQGTYCTACSTLKKQKPFFFFKKTFMVSILWKHSFLSWKTKDFVSTLLHIVYM